MRGWRRQVRNAAEAALCLRIAGAIPLIWIGVHLLPLPAALAWITPRRPAERPIAPQRVRHLAGLLLDRNLLGIRPTCLLRSLVLFRFLRESGASVRVHFGVAVAGRALTGHAWLTEDDTPILEAVDPTGRFTVVLSHPPAATPL
jgi:hypothetical protein